MKQIMCAKKIKYIFLMTSVFVICSMLSFFGLTVYLSAKPNFIKWVDCSATVEVLNKVLKENKRLYELSKQGKTNAIKNGFTFSNAIAYLALKNGNKFKGNFKKDCKNLADLIKKLEGEDSINELLCQNKYWNYYQESYNAIFSEFVGVKTLENGSTAFGIKNCFPLARGYWHSHYDDFGNSRSFGFKRKHLGHDIMGGTGTPLVAVEGGTVVELGWNVYGGWRVGIRSFDKKRYYYYAHLRKDKPFAEGLKMGSEVATGQLIGYLGSTGYSTRENQNLKNCSPHLHIGLQLIFDESQVKGNNEIWIDFYQIALFLNQNRIKVPKT